MIKKLLHIVVALAAVLSLHSCGGGDYAHRLALADTLLAQGNSNGALKELKALPANGLNDDDKAYHALLMTEARLNSNRAIASDSIIGIAVDHYARSGNDSRHARALLLQGCVNEDIGNLDKAVECLHKAEDIAQKDNPSTCAQAKLRLGHIYQQQVVGANLIAVDKYREALPLFDQVNDKHSKLACLSQLGTIYRNIKGKGDSAVLYLNNAITLADSLGDQRQKFSNLFKLAEYYCEIAHNYPTAKSLALRALDAAQGIKTHPRAHYCLALCHLHMGHIDSARIVVDNSPERTTTADIMWYYNTMSEIEKASHNDALSRWYYDQANDMGDSILISSLNHRLLAVEKNYDTQKAELRSQTLQADLHRTLTGAAVIVIAALVIALFALRYRNRLKIKQNEYELLTADLDNSLHSLEEMQSTLHLYENKLTEADESTRKVNEIRNIIDEQIKNLHQLILWSYEYDEKKFAAKFNSMMAVSDGNSESFLKDIQSIANDLHDGILVKAQEAAGGTLRDDEINFLALYCCGFSRTVIMVCMKYKSLGTVYNKRVQIARKLNATNIDEFIKSNKPQKQK